MAEHAREATHPGHDAHAADHELEPVAEDRDDDDEEQHDEEEDDFDEDEEAADSFPAAEPPAPPQRAAAVRAVFMLHTHCLQLCAQHHAHNHARTLLSFALHKQGCGIKPAGGKFC